MQRAADCGLVPNVHVYTLQWDDGAERRKEAEPCKNQRTGRKETDSWSQNQIGPESALTDVVQNMI